MSSYEHLMFGATLALAGGVDAVGGWRLVATASLAAAAADWDGVTILGGPAVFAAGHRTWGHNLAAAGLVGSLIAAVEYRGQWLARLRRAAASRFPQIIVPESLETQSAACRATLLTWIGVGIAAGLSHLPIDMIYSGNARLPAWEVRLLWPFSDRGWTMPIVPWGEPGTTLLFAGEMFALYRWPTHARRVARWTLVLLLVYVGGWWLATR